MQLVRAKYAFFFYYYIYFITILVFYRSNYNACLLYFYVAMLFLFCLGSVMASASDL